MNNLAAELKRGGLRALPAGLDDFDWRWPAKIERDVIERAFTLHFCPRLATSF